MGDLIAFRPQERALARETAAAAPSGPASILLFTGVRYQRDADAPAPARSDLLPGPDSMGGAGGGKKRKRG